MAITMYTRKSCYGSMTQGTAIADANMQMIPTSATAFGPVAAIAELT